MRQNAIGPRSSTTLAPLDRPDPRRIQNEQLVETLVQTEQQEDRLASP
jgi:hypothetical protein